MGNFLQNSQNEHFFSHWRIKKCSFWERKIWILKKMSKFENSFLSIFDSVGIDSLYDDSLTTRSIWFFLLFFIGEEDFNLSHFSYLFSNAIITFWKFEVPIFVIISFTCMKIKIVTLWVVSWINSNS